MGSSSGTAQSTSTQNLTPEQQALVSQAMGGFNQFAGSATPVLPGGAGIAGFTPAQIAGQNAVLGSTGVGTDQPAWGPSGAPGATPTPVQMPTLGGSGAGAGVPAGGAGVPAPGVTGAGPNMRGTVGTAAGTNQYLSSGAFLDPGSNPYVQNAVKAATDPIFQDLSQRTLPAQQAAGAAGSGVNYGGSREGIQEGLDVQGAQRAAGQAGANILNTALGQGLQATNQAIAQAPTTAGSLALPGATTSAVGDVQQQQQQNVLNAQQQAMLENWLLPLLKGQSLASGAASLPGGSVSSTGQTTQQAAPWQIAAGLMAGAGGLMGSGSGGGLLKALMPTPA
jgi:hypothetical protein